MRHGDYGMSSVNFADGLLDMPFGIGIHRRGSLVEYYDGRVAQYGARYRKPLLLPSRKPHSALADLCFISVRHLEYFLVNMRFGSCCYNFVKFCGRSRIGDILRHGTVEQEGVLQYRRDISAQAFKRYFPHVHPVELNAPRNGFVKARYEFRYRGFARARRSDQSYHFAGVAGETYVMQHVLAVAVIEAHVVEGYLAARFADIHGVGRVVYFYRGVEYLYRAFARSVRRLHILNESRQILHRRKEQRQIQQKRHYVFYVYLILIREISARSHHEHRPHRGHEVD